MINKYKTVKRDLENEGKFNFIIIIIITPLLNLFK